MKINTEEENTERLSKYMNALKSQF